MKAKDEMMTTLRHLSLDRKAVIMMKEDISRIEEDIKKEPPAVQREALFAADVQYENYQTSHRTDRTSPVASYLRRAGGTGADDRRPVSGGCFRSVGKDGL